MTELFGFESLSKSISLEIGMGAKMALQNDEGKENVKKLLLDPR